MQTSTTLENLRRGAHVAAELSRDLSTLAPLLDQLDAPAAARLIRELDPADLLTLSNDEATQLLLKLKRALERFHSVRFRLASTTEAGSDQGG